MGKAVLVVIPSPPGGRGISLRSKSKKREIPRHAACLGMTTFWALRQTVMGGAQAAARYSAIKIRRSRKLFPVGPVTIASPSALKKV
jgi:hypothetical protein